MKSASRSKKRMCIKGKSCGASCISQKKRCLIELSPQMSSSLSKLQSMAGIKTNPKAAKRNSLMNELRSLLAKLKDMGPALKGQFKPPRQIVKELKDKLKSAQTNGEKLRIQRSISEVEKRAAREKAASDKRKQIADRVKQIGKELVKMGINVSG